MMEFWRKENWRKELGSWIVEDGEWREILEEGEWIFGGGKKDEGILEEGAWMT